jgi:hypothetical protein
MMRDKATMVNQQHNFLSKLRWHVSFTLPQLKSKLIDDPPIATSVVPTFVQLSLGVTSLMITSINMESVKKPGIILKPSLSTAVISECDGFCMPLDRHWIPSSVEVLDCCADQQEGASQTPASIANDGKALVEGDIRHEVAFRNKMERNAALEQLVRYDLL